MTLRRFGYRMVYAAPLVAIFPFLMGADGNGCGGGPISIGSGVQKDEAGSGQEAGSACTPADCAGLPATLEAKLCSDGTSVGRTVCTKQSDGRCGWDFPPCPPLADAAADAGGPCQCSGPAPGAPNVKCSDGSIGGPACARSICGY